MKNAATVLQKAYQDIPNQTAIHLLFSHKDDEHISYEDLWKGSVSVARALIRAETKPGEVVILILQHSADLIYAFFGCILSGAIPAIMPFLTEKLLPEQYRTSLAALFEITAPSAIITYKDFLDEINKASHGTSIRSILCSEAITSDCKSYSHKRDHVNLPGLKSAPNSIVLLQHSSGTTGLQKGVALSHQAVFNQIDNYAISLNLKYDDRIASWLPLYHDMGLIAGFVLPILSRIPLVLMSPFDWVRAPYRLLQAISQYKATLCWMPNFAYNFCSQKIRDRDLEEVDLASLRAMINCSEPMHWKSHEMFMERFRPYGFKPEALATCYAMAENVFAVTQGGIEEPVTIDVIEREGFLTQNIAKPVEREQAPNKDKRGTLDRIDEIRMLSAGRAIRGTLVKVIDTEGRELAERHIGQIAIKSDCMLTGYFRRPDITKNAFLDGWYLTGDLGYLANGEVYISGRQKDLIIVGGKNIYPQDLERLANEVHGVYPGRAVAFGIFNEQTGTEDIVLIAEAAFTIPENAQAENPEIQARVDGICNEIRKQVTRGSDVTLRYVKLVKRNWLVKTSSGKISRGANREKFLVELV